MKGSVTPSLGDSESAVSANSLSAPGSARGGFTDRPSSSQWPQARAARPAQGHAHNFDSCNKVVPQLYIFLTNQLAFCQNFVPEKHNIKQMDFFESTIDQLPAIHSVISGTVDHPFAILFTF